MPYYTYPLLSCAAFILRVLARLQGRIVSFPDKKIDIESRDQGRWITVHVYQSSHQPDPGPSPVLLNFHGSGFVIPAHGSDDKFCRLISQRTSYTVLDIKYRLAPESPFPAALNDVEDAVKWVLCQPTKYDLSRIAISGFSAGANLALAAASSLFPANTFGSVIAFYPIVDFTNLSSKKAPDMSGSPILAFVLQLFKWCYLQSQVDPRDPRVSPLFAELRSFPARTISVTAARDSLALEAEVLAAKLQQHTSGRHVCLRMDGCDHAWDKTAQDGTYGAEARDRAYNLVIGLLSE